MPGCVRLGLSHRIKQRIPIDLLCPAVGQGALGIEVREKDGFVLELLDGLHDRKAARAVLAERTFLQRLGGGCQVPIAAHAWEEDGGLQMLGVVANLDGSSIYRSTDQAPLAEAELLGTRLAEKLLEPGSSRNSGHHFHHELEGQQLGSCSSVPKEMSLECLFLACIMVHTHKWAVLAQSFPPTLCKQVECFFERPLTAMNPSVFLIGAGPGDPELLTLKGLRCLQVANCVVYDSLVNIDLLQYVRPDAELIYVGKRRGQQSISQDEINQLLVEKAKEGKTVARLKGGDPFVFGRGGEEAEALTNSGVGFEIIPGISSGIAVPAYAGIPVTHRDYSSSVTFLTGHEDTDKGEPGIAWDTLAPGSGTLVFFMGVARLPEIVENLVRCGRPLNTPIAVVQWGTYGKARCRHRNVGIDLEGGSVEPNWVAGDYRCG